MQAGFERIASRRLAKSHFELGDVDQLGLPGETIV